MNRLMSVSEAFWSLQSKLVVPRANVHASVLPLLYAEFGTPRQARRRPVVLGASCERRC
jgi:hypothetical protein